MSPDPELSHLADQPANQRAAQPAPRAERAGPVTPRVEIRRHAERGRYDRDTLLSILDEGFICHLGVVVDGRPMVVPTTYGRIGDTLYLHGAATNRSLAAALDEVCVTVTLVDGLVLARSLFGHSINFRSAVVMGRARPITDAGERRAALEAIVEQIAPGRWSEARLPTPKELENTTVIALDLSEASAKVRTGPPLDPASDRRLPVWAGELPLRQVAGSPRPDGDLDPSISVPESVHRLRDRFAGWTDDGG